MAVNGYFDGYHIQVTDAVNVKKYQKVIITILDDFIDLEQEEKRSAKGILSAYANPALEAQEEGAWERAAAEKYADA